MLPLQPSDRKTGQRGFGEGRLCSYPGRRRDAGALRPANAFAKWAMPSTVTGAASNEVDSVDGAPAHQANLPKAAPNCSVAATPGRQRLPRKFRSHAAGGQRFVRKYSTTSRPRLPFHCDGCDASISVNLVDGSEYDGGDLVMLSDNALMTAPRQAGSAAGT